MAHYALLDENNKVVNVITGIDETELIEGKSPEQWYGEFHNMKCLRTSYWTANNEHKLNGTPFRGNYAGINYVYNEEWDIFIPPQPYPSWNFNYKIAAWEPPIPMPPMAEDYGWRWGEFAKAWIKISYNKPV